MKDFAGSMRERVELMRRTPGRDAMAEAGEDWTVIDLVWATARPINEGVNRRESYSRPTRWRVELRPCAVQVGDRIARVTNTLDVLEVVAEPALPDRVMVVGEVVR